MRVDTTTFEGAVWAIENGWHVDREDVGMSAVIDLCRHCAHNQGIEDVADAEHPPYEDDDYVCALCSAELDDIND